MYGRIASHASSGTLRNLSRKGTRGLSAMAKNPTQRPRVYVTRKFFDEALDLIRTVADVESFDSEDDPIPRSVLLDELSRGSFDGVLPMLTESIDREVLDAAGPNLRVVSNYAVGYNNVSVGDATERGVMVTNTPDVLNDATADCAFALLMAVARRVVDGDNYVRSGEWKRAWGPRMMLGSDVSGKTLGIVGMGRIGECMVPRARGFGMRILYHNRNRLNPVREAELGVEYREWDALLSESDFVSVHVPLSPATENIISERELQKMKPTSFLINTSRGGTVDEKALAKALDEGWIAGAGLDVHIKEPTGPADGNPLLKFNNVVLAPHIGSATTETRLAMAMRAAENMVAVLKGERPRDLVNPEVWDK